MRLARILLWIVATALSANQQLLSAKSIPFDSRFVSPDGSYAVDLVMIDKEQHFPITDLKTGSVDSAIVMPSLILYLRWTAQSRAFVTVEHISGGSYGRVVCLNGSKWASSEVAPPDDSTLNYKVISLEIKRDFVRFRFSVDYEKANRIPFA